jgi:NADH dehydrogenase
MKVAVFGGTGFIGSYIVDALVAAGHHPVLLVRPGSGHKVRHARECTLIYGALDQSTAVNDVLSEADAAIYNVGILRENAGQGISFEGLQFKAARRVIDAAEHLGVRRFLLMSANGVGDSGTAYQTSKFAAERHLANSDLEWTVFRPSVVFGDPRGRSEFATQLLHDVIESPLPAPLFYAGLSPSGAGTFELSPVHVEDVARAFVAALDDSSTVAEVIELGGPARISWRQILQIIASAVGRSKTMLPVPAIGVSTAAALFDRFEAFPVTRDQIDMLLQGNTCGVRGLTRLGIDAKPFSPETLGYLNKARKEGAAWQQDAA